jgi:chaperonin GroEL
MQNNGLPAREIKDIWLGDDATTKVAAGARKISEVVGSTYGPSGRNVILGMPFGDSTLTRDGVTVAKRTILKDKAEDDAAVILRQASEKTNKSAGDGTTATIVLGNNIFQRGNRLIAAGENGMILKKQIIEDSHKVIKYLESVSVDGNDHLLEVATVSSGDPAIGALISDTLREVGDSGGISIREQNYPTIDVEKVGGYLFDKGFFALNQMVEYSQPLIFVTQKQFASNSEMVPLLSRVISGDNKNLVIIGEVRVNSEAMNTLLLNVMQGKLNAVVIPPPAYNDQAIAFMEDISIYVGCKSFLVGDDIKAVDDTYFGTADRVQTSDKRCIIFNGNGAGEDVEARAALIKDQIDKETESHGKDNLEQRYAKLTGKIAIVNVGGSTQTEMEELRYRVEDAIEATKSAMADGVLPGGATMLVRAAATGPSGITGLTDISKLFRDALEDTFRHLMNNAAEPADYRLEQVKRSEFGFGFDLRAITDEPIDLREAGIYDATRAIVQTIENATSAAASLLTVGAMVTPVEDINADRL